MIMLRRTHERLMREKENEIAMLYSDLRLTEKLRKEKEETNQYLREKCDQLIKCVSTRDVVNNLLVQQGSKLVP